MRGGTCSSSSSAPYTEAQGCPNLTYQQRIIGFISCCCFGYLLSFIGTVMLFSGGSTVSSACRLDTSLPAERKDSQFRRPLYRERCRLRSSRRPSAATRQVGNFIAISATLFLIGPRRQCQKMFDKTRRFSTIIWLCA